MTQREFFKETFSQLHASPDTLSEVMNMAKHENITYINKTKRRPARKLIAIAAVAALLVTGVFAAGTAIYKMSSEPIGEYGLSLMVEFEEGTSVETAQTPVLNITAGWLPEGMALNPGESVKWSYEDTPFQGGFSITTWALNTGKETFRETITSMQSRESLVINGHEAEYVTLLNLESDSVSFNQRLYVAYPEYNQVLCIYIGENMDKDTALKFAENLVLAETGEYWPQDQIDYHGEWYKAAEKTARTEERHNVDEDTSGAEMQMTATAAEMANVHQIGESFARNDWTQNTEIRVTKVAVGDDGSIFASDGWKDSDLASKLAEDGSAPVNTIQFVKQGDGLSTLTEIVAEKEEATKLVAVTFEVTNNTDETQEHIHYMASYLTIEETEDGYAIWEPTPDTDVDYDYVSMSKVWGDHGMRYYSVVDDYGNGGNYIPSLAPGETATVEVGFLVSESELDKLYLNLDGGGVWTFDEDGLAMGYVDIHQ